jgi:hypothetical protein
MSDVVDILRKSLTARWDEEDRRRVTGDARRAVRRIRRTARRLIHDRITQRVPLPHLVRNRIFMTHAYLLELEFVTCETLSAINRLGNLYPEEQRVWFR